MLNIIYNKIIFKSDLLETHMELAVLRIFAVWSVSDASDTSCFVCPQAFAFFSSIIASLMRRNTASLCTLPWLNNISTERTPVLLEDNHILGLSHVLLSLKNCLLAMLTGAFGHHHLPDTNNLYLFYYAACKSSKAQSRTENTEIPLWQGLYQQSCKAWDHKIFIFIFTPPSLQIAHVDFQPWMNNI